MTTIVAVKSYDGKSIFVGGDSLAASGLHLRTVVTPKVFHPRGALHDVMIIGYTSSFRMGQLLQFSLDCPVQEEDLKAENVDRYMATTFITAVRECFTKNGWMGKFGQAHDQDYDRNHGGVFLVAVLASDGPHIYYVGSEFIVLEHAEDFDAVGCGRELALASLRTMDLVRGPVKSKTKAAADKIYGQRGPLSTEQRVRLALSVACEFSTSRSPFTVLGLGPEAEEVKE